MIQPIGKNPVRRPRPVARKAMPSGIVKASHAISTAAVSATTAAIWTLTLPLAIMISRKTAGTAAIMVESTEFSNGL